MNGETKPMKMPNYLKKKLKDGMIKEPKVWVQSWRICSFVQLSFQILCRKTPLKMGRSLCYRGGLPVRRHQINNSEGTNPKVVNGQRIKHYISGTPINVESNIIQTLTPEEHIKETIRNTPESWKRGGTWYVSTWTPKNPQKYFLSVFRIFRKLGK